MQLTHTIVYSFVYPNKKTNHPDLTPSGVIGKQQCEFSENRNARFQKAGMRDFRK